MPNSCATSSRDQQRARSIFESRSASIAASQVVDLVQELKAITPANQLLERQVTLPLDDPPRDRARLQSLGRTLLHEAV